MSDDYDKAVHEQALNDLGRMARQLVTAQGALAALRLERDRAVELLREYLDEGCTCRDRPDYECGICTAARAFLTQEPPK